MLITHLHTVPNLRVEQYLHSPYTPSWRGQEQRYFLFRNTFLGVLIAPSSSDVLTALPRISRRPRKLSLYSSPKRHLKMTFGPSLTYPDKKTKSKQSGKTETDKKEERQTES
jgi:hypothetical protein